MRSNDLFNLAPTQKSLKSCRIITESEMLSIREEINHLVVVANLNEAIVIYKHLQPLPVINGNLRNDEILVFESTTCQRYYIGKLSETPVVLTALSDMGSIKVNASVYVTDEAIRIFDPKFAIMIGICASLNPKVNIGDVVIANPIVSYDSKKETDRETIYRGQRFYPHLLINRFDNISLPQFKNFKVFKGEVASGETLVNSASFKKNLLNAYPEILALEMEGIGFAGNCIKKNVHWVLIKGISDNGENKKDDYQQYATENAYQVAKLIFDTKFPPQLLKPNKLSLKRKSVFISGALAARDTDCSAFVWQLVTRLLEKGYRIVTALGNNIGNDILQATYQFVANEKIQRLNISDFLVTLQFPYSAIKGFSKDQLPDYYKLQRKLLLQECSTALFLFGNKSVNQQIVLSDGMMQEFEIAKELNVFPIPIAYPQTMSQKIWDLCREEYSQIYSKFFASNQSLDDTKKVFRQLKLSKATMTKQTENTIENCLKFMEFQLIP